MAGSVIAALLSPVLSLASIVLVLIVVIAGSHPHLLTDFYFLKTSISDLNLPSRLANSTFLKDLSTLTGTDWIGEQGTKHSLGLADSYTVGLLAACAEGNVTNTCSSPRVGFHFDPLTHLKLQQTSLQGTFPSSFLSALNSYKSLSGFLGGAYILAIVLLVLAPLIGLFASRRPSIAYISATFAFIASLMLLAASITAPVVFSKLSSAINSAFSSSGISSSFGSSPIIVSWFATLLALAAALVLFFRARSATPSKRRNRGGVSKLNLSTRDIEPVRGPSTASRKTPFSAVLQRIPTFGQARYTQVEKQPQVVAVGGGRSHRNSAEADRELLFQADGVQGHVIHENDHEDDDENDAPQGFAHGGPRGIQMQSIGGSRGTRDINLAYEPFSRGV